MKVDPAEFEAWCNWSEPNENAFGLDATKFVNESLQGGMADNEVSPAFLDEILSRIRDGSKPVMVTAAGTKAYRGLFRLDFSSIRPDKPFTSTTKSHLILLTLRDAANALVSGGVIRDVQITQKPQKLIFESCYLARIRVNPKSYVELELHQCWVGVLEIYGESLSRLVIDGGSIRSIKCPPPHGENPFTGSVSISPNVDFPTSPEWKLLGRSQGYRNLRHHLEDLQNVPVANLMRHIELQTDFRYREDTGLRRFINLVYGFFSDHGNSPGKPLAWMFGLWVCVGFVLFHFDGGVQALPDPLFTGWRDGLQGEGSWAQLVRTVYLIVQSTFNPLGLLGSRHLVVAESGWAHGLLIFQGLFSDALILMTIFGIRKRFKVS